MGLLGLHLGLLRLHHLGLLLLLHHLRLLLHHSGLLGLYLGLLLLDDHLGLLLDDDLGGVTSLGLLLLHLVGHHSSLVLVLGRGLLGVGLRVVRLLRGDVALLVLDGGRYVLLDGRRSVPRGLSLLHHLLLRSGTSLSLLLSRSLLVDLELTLAGIGLELTPY